MRRARHATLFALLGAFALGAIASWTAAGGAKHLWRWLNDESGASPASREAAPSIEAVGAQTLILREQGRKMWEFSAARIEISTDRRFATATGVQRGTLYRDDKPYLQLRAARVRLNQETRDWEAIGPLKAHGPHGFSLQTQRATWRESEQQLQCPGAVRATLRGMTFQTKKVLYDVRRNALLCPDKIAIRSQHATLAGQNAVADTKKRLVEFRGGVEIVVRRESAQREAARRDVVPAT